MGGIFVWFYICLDPGPSTPPYCLTPLPSLIIFGHSFLPRNYFQPQERPKKSESVKSELEVRDFGKSVGGSARGRRGVGWGAGMMWD